jgi:hypothetical protein
VVESGHKLADVDNAVVTRVGRDGLLRAIYVNVVEPLEVAAGPQVPGNLHAFLNAHRAQVTAQVWCIVKFFSERDKHLAQLWICWAFFR